MLTECVELHTHISTMLAHIVECEFGIGSIVFIHSSEDLSKYFHAENGRHNIERAQTHTQTHSRTNIKQNYDTLISVLTQIKIQVKALVQCLSMKATVDLCNLNSKFYLCSLFHSVDMMWHFLSLLEKWFCIYTYYLTFILLLQSMFAILWHNQPHFTQATTNKYTSSSNQESNQVRRNSMSTFLVFCCCQFVNIEPVFVFQCGCSTSDNSSRMIRCISIRSIVGSGSEYTTSLCHKCL